MQSTYGMGTRHWYVQGGGGILGVCVLGVCVRGVGIWGIYMGVMVHTMDVLLHNPLACCTCLQYLHIPLSTHTHYSPTPTHPLSTHTHTPIIYTQAVFEEAARHGATAMGGGALGDDDDGDALPAAMGGGATGGGNSRRKGGLLPEQVCGGKRGFVYVLRAGV